MPIFFNSGELRDVFMHEDAVYGISVDPTNDNVFASACVDGRILIYDIRLPPQSGKPGYMPHKVGGPSVILSVHLSLCKCSSTVR